MFFYQSKERLSFEEINTKTVQLIEKFLAQVNYVSKDEPK
jgi:ribonuclease P protein component